MKALGIPSVILFGLPESKDEMATGAWDDDGIVQKAARAIKREVPGLLLMGDVCLCEYMSHGHCGIVDTTDPTARRAGGHAVRPRAGIQGKGVVSRCTIGGSGNRCHRRCAASPRNTKS